MMNVVIATGGTGGHLFPALKVAEELRSLGHQAHFVGSLGVGTEQIVQRKFSYRNIPSQGFQKKNIIAFIVVAAAILKAIGVSFRILKEIKPDKVLGFGGYAAFSVVIAAWFLKIPTMIHEQNVIPGRANKILSFLVKKIAVSFDDAKKYFPSSKTVLTGCPSHLSPQNISREEAYRFFGLKANVFTILVFGGSQGSHCINEIFLEMLPALRQQMDVQVVHVTGKNDFDVIKSRYGVLHIPHAVFPFLDRMDYAYTIADLVIARSGAATITELCLFGCPAILIPFPYAIGQHQAYNARVLVKQNLAMMIEEKDLSSVRLKEKICDMMKNKIPATELNQGFREIVFVDAASRLAKEVISL